MKKYLVVLALAVGACSPVMALPLNDDLVDSKNKAWTHIKGNVKWTAIGGVRGGAFQSFESGNDSASQASIFTHVLTYKDVLTADIGGAFAFNGREVGTVLGGPGVKVKNLLGKLFPGLAEFASASPRSKLDTILSAHFINFACGWRTDNGAFDYGMTTGFQKKF